MIDRKSLAVVKVIKCIDSSTTADHLAGCKRLLNFIKDYGVKNSTLTYLFMLYRQKHRSIHFGE